MARIIYGLSMVPSQNQKVIDFAVAASALKHTVLGDFNMATVKEVEKLLKGDPSGRDN